MVDVSVIVPALNAAGTIERAVRSAANQTLRTIEIIVVDDGSEDRTGAIVNDLSEADARIRLIRHPDRQGVSAARNTAINAASGEWIAVLDADDWFAPDRLANLVEHGRAHRLDAVIDNLTTVDAATGRILGTAFPREWMTPTQPLPTTRPVELDTPYRQRMGFGYCKPVFRRDAFLERVGGYATSFRCGEDLLALQLLLFGNAAVGTVDSAGYYYSIDAGSHSNRPGTSLDISNVNRLLIREAEQRGLIPAVGVLKKRQIVIDYDYFAKAANQGQVMEALTFLRRLPFRVLAQQPLRILGRRLGLDLLRLDPRDPRWRWSR